MSARKFLFSILIFASALTSRGENSVLEKSFPLGVQIGMPLSAIITARPQAREAVLTVKEQGRQMVETVSSGDTRVAYWYRFKNETLGAVTKSVMVGNIPVEQVQQSVNAILVELKESFNIIGSDQIVRSTGSQSELLTAQHWKEKDGALELFFVASNQEITLVFFDSKNFEKRDFFLGSERLPEVRESEKYVRILLKELKPNPAKSKPDLLVDILSQKSIEIDSTSSQSSRSQPPLDSIKLQSISTAVTALHPLIDTKVLAAFPNWLLIGGIALAVLAAGAVAWKYLRRQP